MASSKLKSCRFPPLKRNLYLVLSSTLPETNSLPLKTGWETLEEPWRVYFHGRTGSLERVSIRIAARVPNQPEMLFTVSHLTPLFEYTPLNFKNNLRRRPFVLFWNVAPANQKSLFQGEVKAALDEVSSFGGLIYLPICLLTYLLWELFKVIQTNPSIQIDICIKAYPYIYISVWLFVYIW